MQQHTRKIIYIGMLSAIAFVFYYIEFSAGFLFPATPFLKIDFSDVPAFIAALGLGPVSGILVELIKNILHITITKEPALSGEIGNFLSGLCMILPAYFVLHRPSEKFFLQKIIAIAASAISCALVMIVFNYFVTLPLYGISDVTVKYNMLLFGFLPFNLIKGIVISAISILLFALLKKHKIF